MLHTINLAVPKRHTGRYQEDEEASVDMFCNLILVPENSALNVSVASEPVMRIIVKMAAPVVHGRIEARTKMGSPEFRAHVLARRVRTWAATDLGEIGICVEDAVSWRLEIPWYVLELAKAGFNIDTVPSPGRHSNLPVY